MILIATGNPTAKLDESGEVIDLRIPSGNRQSVTVDLTPNQALLLMQRLERATMDFFKAQKANKDWRAENVLAFPSSQSGRP